MKPTTKTIALISVLLLVVYGLLFVPARSGWGYMGYQGYNSGPSFFYWGGVNTYYDRPSARSGSRGGTSHDGGGTARGK